MAKSDVAKTNASLPADLLSDMAADAKTSFGNVTPEDYAIPFLNILQQMSPQVNKTDGAYIQGAESGMIYNTVTQKFYPGSEGVRVIPCAYKRMLIEWKPREEGGGLVAVHDPSSGILKEAKRDGARDMLPSGNYLQNTAHHYVLILGEGTAEQAIMPLSSTQLKKSRRWNSLMVNQRIDHQGKKLPAPPYAFSYSLTTVPESNEQGSWFGWQIGNPEMITDIELYQSAKNFGNSVQSGEVEVQPQDDSQTVTNDNSIL